MRKFPFLPFVVLAHIQFILGIALMPPSQAQEWEVREARGTITVVELVMPTMSVLVNYAESLVTLDKDNNWVPCLARNWRWVDDHTIEFKLRKGVRFHNGEELNAEAVRVNWEHYRSLKCPKNFRLGALPDETLLETIDEYTVRFTFPEPDGLALLRIWGFGLFAPSFFREHKFEEMNWAYLTEPGPWGAGLFKLAEGGFTYLKPTGRIVLEAFEDYWDPRYPKVNKVIFDNTLIGNRKEAMRLCREEEGRVDIVTQIRPLDTLKVAESPFAKVVKSRDASILWGAFNQRKKDSKWRDIRLRKAVNYAINREELWEYCAKGNAHSLGGFIPSGAFGHNPDLKLYTYDTEKARSLVAEAGYPNGFEVKLISAEAWKLEAQIISRMLERVGLKVKREVLSMPDLWRKVYAPLLEKPAEDQDWDLSMWYWFDLYGHTGGTYLTFGFTDGSDIRWIEYDSAFEEMWEKMAKTVILDAQEEEIRQMVEHLYERAYGVFIYSPLTLYAVNKNVSFVPQTLGYLRLKETSVTDNHWSLREKN